MCEDAIELTQLPAMVENGCENETGISGFKSPVYKPVIHENDYQNTKRSQGVPGDRHPERASQNKTKVLWALFASAASRFPMQGATTNTLSTPKKELD